METLRISGMTVPMPMWGSVELHGCNVGAMRYATRRRMRVETDGPAYVQLFADTVGRPVVASTVGDYYGTMYLDTRYNGPVVSCVPGGGETEDWFESHPVEERESSG
jgi:hypothetical protein